jgi:hypothetical protein
LISVSLAPTSYFFCASAGVANIAPSVNAMAAADLNRDMPSSLKRGRGTSPHRRSVSLYQKAREEIAGGRVFAGRYPLFSRHQKHAWARL